MSKEKAEAEVAYQGTKDQIQRLQADLEQMEKETKKAIQEAG